MYVGNFFLLILNIPLIRIFVKIMEVPFAMLSPLIVLICVIGGFSINNNPVDVLIMLIFGGVGYLMRKFDYEPAPLMLAFILGPMLEKSTRQSLIVSHGSPMIFFTRPIPLVLIVVALFTILSPLLLRFLKRSHLVSSIKETRKPDE
jgi:putative tricarboxylic transport membrane protein